MEAINTHLVYSDLLYNCLTLAEKDALLLIGRPVPVVEYPDDYRIVELRGHKVNVPQITYNDLYFQGVRSIPTDTQKLFACDYLSQRYDLEGVPGFYKPDRWKLNLTGKGLLRPYREGLRIKGLFIYKDHLDTEPRLLSSEGLYKGTPALQPYEEEEREVA